jgi:hypothetical protein
MDFNLPRYTERFEGTCDYEFSNLPDDPLDSCSVNEYGHKIFDDRLADMRSDWIENWQVAYNRDDDASDCQPILITKLINFIKNTDDKVIKSLEIEKNNNFEFITSGNESLTGINNSIEDIETNFLLGEQRLLETQGLNYINNAKFYIFIALIIILLLIQLMLILL